MKNLRILIHTGIVAGLIIMAYSFYAAHTLTPELLSNLYLGTAFFFLLIFRAITAEAKEFNIKANVAWSKISLIFGYILIFFSFYALIFNVSYPGQGFIVAFVTPIAVLCFLLSYRFYEKDEALIKVPSFVNKVILVILSAIVVIYLYDIPETKSYPSIKYSALLSILFIIWTFLVLYFIIKKANRRDSD